MSIQKRVACPLLTDFVEYYWVWEGPATAEAPPLSAAPPTPIQWLPVVVVVSDPYQTISLDRELVRSRPAGPEQPPEPRRYTRPTSQIGEFGVRFRPTGFYNLFGVPLAEMATDTLAPDCAARSFGRELMQRVRAAKTAARHPQAAEALLLARLRQVQPAFTAADFAALHIVESHGQVSIDALATEAHLSSRQLERQFLAKVGMSPKFYAQLARFNHVFQIMQEEPTANWVDVAYRCGYYDQAHFIREFHRFAGESPAAYFQHSDACAPLFGPR